MIIHTKKQIPVNLDTSREKANRKYFFCLIAFREQKNIQQDRTSPSCSQKDQGKFSQSYPQPVVFVNPIRTRARLAHLAEEDPVEKLKFAFSPSDDTSPPRPNLSNIPEVSSLLEEISKTSLSRSFTCRFLSAISCRRRVCCQTTLICFRRVLGEADAGSPVRPHFFFRLFTTSLYTRTSTRFDHLTV